MINYCKVSFLDSAWASLILGHFLVAALEADNCDRNIDLPFKSYHAIEGFASRTMKEASWDHLIFADVGGKYNSGKLLSIVR